MLGGGGHARVLIDSLQLSGACAIRGILDRDTARHGGVVLGVLVLGGDELLAGLAQDGVAWFVVGFAGVRDNRPRQRMFEEAVAKGLRPLTVVHPSAIVSRHAVIGAGCQIFPGAIVNAGAVLGAHVIVNSGAIVEHDCRVGDHAHVAPAACLAATVIVGERAHIGAGSTLRQGVTVGADAVVGAGAAVVNDVPSEHVVVGVPARQLMRR